LFFYDQQIRQRVRSKNGAVETPISNNEYVFGLAQIKFFKMPKKRRLNIIPGISIKAIKRKFNASDLLFFVMAMCKDA
jgi:hypothetical protein